MLGTSGNYSTGSHSFYTSSSLRYTPTRKTQIVCQWAHWKLAASELLKISLPSRNEFVGWHQHIKESKQVVKAIPKSSVAGWRQSVYLVRQCLKPLIFLGSIFPDNYTIDDRTTDWLLSGEPRLCLNKLKEIDDMLKPCGQVRALDGLLTSTEDKLSMATAFFDEHNSIFHFLPTSDVWNNESLLQQPPQIDTLPTTDDMYHIPQDTQTSGITTIVDEVCEDGLVSLLHTDQTSIATHKQRFLQEKLEEVSRWLSPLDCTQKHNDVLKLRQEGTCMWLPNTDTFKSWRAGWDQFLWLHGKGGCGKSVLIASTIEHLKNTLRDEEVVAFFYCDFRNERSIDPTEVMRSLLSQLMRHFRDCGLDPGDIPTKILEQKSQGTLSLNDLDKLCDLVSHAAGCFRYDPIIVIDALDECADIGTLLSALVALRQADVRLLVTSRPHQTIIDHFMGFQSLSLENVAQEMAGDIALHIRREVESHYQLRSSDQDMKEGICSKLNEKPDGRFRWVHCQLDTLKRCATRQELGEALDDLPDELEAMYEKILGSIDERKSEVKLARCVLAWLAVALEPLRLACIVEGLSIEFQEQAIVHESPGYALVQALSCLVSHNEETDVLAFSHLSVKEYLTSRMALPICHIVSHEAHAEVAQICMNYISVFLKQGPSCGNVSPFQAIPMLSYVLSSGFKHLAHVCPESTVVLDSLRSLGSDVRHHPSHWDHLCELRDEVLRWSYPPWPSSRHDFVLYILIAYSSPELLQSFLSSHPLNPRVGTNPLVYAVDLRKTEHAIALLASGADVNMRSFVIDDSHHTFPLEVAIDLNNVLVGELLQRGSLIASELLTVTVCMPSCSTRVLIQADKFVEWAHEIGVEKLYHSVLFNSARPNAEDNRKTDEDDPFLARRLHQIGQNLAIDCPFAAKLIERAAREAHTSKLDCTLPPDQPPPSRFLPMGYTSELVSMVRFLLNKGVDVHAVSDRHGNTALHLAAMCFWEPRSLELTQMLIDAGCGPDSLNSCGETPLAIAEKFGHFSVVELLLSRSAILLPSNVLHIALEKGWPSLVIETLILKGADVHNVSPTGNTVLHSAIIPGDHHDSDEDEEHNSAAYVESDCLHWVECFIDAGCNPISRNFRGETVLEFAIEREFLSVVEFLLSCNVPFPPDILLIALRKCSTLSMVKYLMDKDADVHSPTDNGDTVLHLAITEYYVEAASWDLVKNVATPVVELLLRYGVPLPPTSYQSRSGAAALLRCSDCSSTKVLITTALRLRLGPIVILYFGSFIHRTPGKHVSKSLKFLTL